MSALLSPYFTDPEQVQGECCHGRDGRYLGRDVALGCLADLRIDHIVLGVEAQPLQAIKCAHETVRSDIDVACVISGNWFRERQGHGHTCTMHGDEHGHGKHAWQHAWA